MTERPETRRARSMCARMRADGSGGGAGRGIGGAVRRNGIGKLCGAVARTAYSADTCRFAAVDNERILAKRKFEMLLGGGIESHEPNA